MARGPLACESCPGLATHALDCPRALAEGSTSPVDREAQAIVDWMARAMRAEAKLDLIVAMLREMDTVEWPDCNCARCRIMRAIQGG